MKKKCFTIPSERNREKLDAFVATFSDALIRSIDERRDAGSFAQHKCKSGFGTHTIPNTHHQYTDNKMEMVPFFCFVGLVLPTRMCVK